MTVTFPPARGDVGVLLAEWIRLGPGGPAGPRDRPDPRISTGQEISLGEIPFEYHDSRESRDLAGNPVIFSGGARFAAVGAAGW